MTSCLIHNNRDRLQGFTSWVEELVESEGVNQYRQRVTDFETLSMWQGLSTGVSNKCSYCMAACPAGDELVGEYLASKESYRERVLQPLRARTEPIYVLSGSDAEAHVKRHFPNKTSQPIRSGLRSRSVRQFLEALPLAFNRGQAGDLRATYEFTFTGEEPCQATVAISDRKVRVVGGPASEADVRVNADSRTWLRVLAKEQSLLGALLRRKIRVRGSRQLMNRFARCFPM